MTVTGLCPRDAALPSENCRVGFTTMWIRGFLLLPSLCLQMWASCPPLIQAFSLTYLGCSPRLKSDPHPKSWCDYHVSTYSVLHEECLESGRFDKTVSYKFKMSVYKYMLTSQPFPSPAAVCSLSREIDHPPSFILTTKEKASATSTV